MGESELFCHTSPVDGEITLKFGNGYLNVMSIQCKDYYREFVCIRYERPTAVYKWEEKYLIILLSLIGRTFQDSL